MTHKAIALEFVVPTVVAIVLGIVLGMGAVYLTNRYLGPLDQAELQAAPIFSRDSAEGAKGGMRCEC